MCRHKLTECPIPNYQLCELCGTYKSLKPGSPEGMYAPGYWAGEQSTLWEQVWNVDQFTEGGVSKNRFVIERVESDRQDALDIGCAPGRLMFYLKHAAKFKAVLGIDPAASQEDIATLSCKSGAFIKGMFPAISKGLPERSIDLITCLDILEHVPEPEPFLDECWRLLRTHGQIFLMMPMSDNLPPDSRMFNHMEHVWLHSRKNLEDLLAKFKYLKFDKWADGHETISARKI